MTLKNFSEILLSPYKTLILSKKEILFNVNDIVTSFFIVKKGSIKLCRNQIGGKTFTLQRAKSEDILSEASFFSDSYHCYAEAINHCELRAYSKSDVLNEFIQFPEKLLLFTQIMAKEVMNLRNILEQNTVLSSEERVKSYFRQLSIKQNTKTILLSTSLLEISFELGMQRETLYRILAHLSNKKLVTRHANTITLHFI